MPHSTHGLRGCNYQLAGLFQAREDRPQALELQVERDIALETTEKLSEAQRGREKRREAKSSDIRREK
jgi:hypothetical protein